MAGTERDMGGRRIGRYEVFERLGEGGMGEVYRAEDAILTRSIVIKRLNIEEGADPVRVDERNRRLKREARIHAGLEHPNIVRVYDFVVDDGACHIVAELVTGGSLRSKLNAKRPGVVDAMRMLLEISRGLRYAHDRGIVHRDLKAENVMVAADGTLKITDFGLSRSNAPLPAGGVDSLSTLTGAFVGTLVSMSPEQTVGDPVDARSDLFALGVLAYELFTGVNPFAGPTPLDVLDNIRRRPHRPALELCDDVPLEIAEVIDRLLEKDRETRPDSADVLVELLERLTSGVHVDSAYGPRSSVSRQVAVLHVRFFPGIDQTGVEDEDDARLIAFHVAARELARQHSAQVLYSAGHDVQLCFGYPRTAGEGNACLAAKVVDELARRVAPDGQSAPVGAGLDVGQIAIHGDSPSIIFTGAPLRRSTSVAQEARAGQLLTTIWARPHLAHGGYGVRRIGDLAAGTPDPRLTYAVVPGSGESLVDEPIPRSDVLRLLESSAREAVGDGGGRVVALEGEAGIGKSTVVRMLRRAFVESVDRFIVVNATPSGGYAPFDVIRRLLVEQLSIADRTAIERIAREAPDWQAVLAATAEICGVAIDDDVSTLDAVSKRLGPDALAAHVATFLLHALATSTSIIVFEDVHWTDRQTRRVLTQLVDRASEIQMLLVLSYRPTVRPWWAAHPWVASMALSPLARAEAEALVDLVPGAASLKPRLRVAILDRAGGIPLNIVELTQTVLDIPALADRSEGTLDVVPMTVRDSVQLRMQSLSARAQRVAQLAALIGRKVPVALLEAAMSVARPGFDADVEALEASGLVRRLGLLRERFVVFRHALTVEFIDKAITSDTRHDLHASICRALEATELMSAAEDAAFFARQYEGAGRPEAISHWKNAGLQAARLRAHEVACEHFEAALRLLNLIDDDVRRTEAERELRRALASSLVPAFGNGSRRIEANNVRLHELAQSGSEPLNYVELLEQWKYAYVTCDVDQISTLFGLLQESVEGLGEHRLVPEYILYCARGIVDVHLGRLSNALECLDAAAKLRDSVMPAFEKEGDKLLVVTPACYSAWCHALKGDIDAANESLRAEEARFEEGSPERHMLTSLGALVSSALFDFESAATKARIIVGLPRDTLADNHVIYNRFMLEISEIHLALAADEVDIDTLCQRLHRARKEIVLTTAQIRAGTTVQYALFITAAVEVLQSEVCTGVARERVLELASDALSCALADLQDSGVEAMHRYYVSELHRARSRLAAAMGDESTVSDALEAAATSCAQLERAAGWAPKLLLDRLQATRQRLQHARA